MLKCFGNFFLIVALFTATDAQWMVLQSVAWAGMIISYSEKAPLKVALMHTFDGKHPCPLCKAIAAAKKSERKNDFTLQVKKLEFPPVPENFVLVAPSQFQLLPFENAFAETLVQQPLTPPPRIRFA
ncbi:MAG TPA: hypothetical protein VMA13_05880 [Candidatus Saccharimonadales bacterium]|nr:hypothetical protein [Candidatus Saccharimonadales bacterium]